MKIWPAPAFSSNGTDYLTRINQGIRLLNSQLLQFGTTNGTDWDFYHNGSDMYLQKNTGGLMLALAASPPAPDNDFVHIWNGSAGTITAQATSLLVIEDDASIRIEVMTPAANFGQLIMSSPTADDFGALSYNHASMTPASTWRISSANAERLYYSAGAFAFQETTTISTSAGSLDLDPTTNVRLNTNNNHGTTVGTNILSAGAGTAPAGGITDAASLYTQDATAVWYKINEAGTASVVG